MFQEMMVAGNGGGGVGDYTKFKQGTFISNNSGEATVSDVGFTPKHLILVPRTEVSTGVHNVIEYDELKPDIASSNLYSGTPFTSSNFRSGSVYIIGSNAGSGYGALSQVNSTGFKIKYTDKTVTWDYYAYG